MAKAAKAEIPAIIEKPKTVKRKIYYYDCLFDFQDTFKVDKQEDQFLGFFSIIAKLVADKSVIRYKPVHEADVFFQDVIFDDRIKKITGKLQYVRSDVLPELINKQTDETKGFADEKFDSIVETTHFVIDYSRPLRKMAIEYNHVGGKINDFMTYCRAIGDEVNAFKNISCEIIAKEGGIKKMQKEIGGCHSLSARVHTNNINEIGKINKGLMTMFKDLEKHFSTKYIEIKLSFSVSTKINKTVKDSLTNIDNNKNLLTVFESLKVNAEDKTNDLKMKIFDLLLDKEESDLLVERKPKHKVVVSVDIFAKMKDEFIKKNI